MLLLALSAAVGLFLLYVVFFSDVWDEEEASMGSATVQMVFVTPTDGGLVVDGIIEDDPDAVLGLPGEPVTVVIPAGVDLDLTDGHAHVRGPLVVLR